MALHVHLLGVSRTEDSSSYPAQVGGGVNGQNSLNLPEEHEHPRVQGELRFCHDI